MWRKGSQMKERTIYLFIYLLKEKQFGFSLNGSDEHLDTLT